MLVSLLLCCSSYKKLMKLEQKIANVWVIVPPVKNQRSVKPTLAAIKSFILKHA